jgi:peptide deformylase
MKIVKNKKKLRIPTYPCDSVEEGLEIGEKLIDVLSEVGGIGLAANQVGIPKSVCVVSARKDSPPVIMVNPRCVEASEDMVAYYESCLSIPGKSVRTIRHSTVSVECDNWENKLSFGPDSEELNAENYWQDEGLLESVCIQHEMGHLDGKLITDPEFRLVRESKRSERIGRNQKVMVKKGDKTQFIKYKKAENLLKDGWEII